MMSVIIEEIDDIISTKIVNKNREMTIALYVYNLALIFVAQYRVFRRLIVSDTVVLNVPIPHKRSISHLF